jgi:hypothetical protein
MGGRLMAQRTAHGEAAKGGALVVHENLPFDELARPDPSAEPSGPIERRPDGTVAGSEAARELARLAVAKRAFTSRILRSLGLVELAGDHAFYVYEVAGQDFADAYIASLASMFDGVCGEGPVSIAKTAGMQLAISRYFYDQGKQAGDAKLLGQASQLANDSRVSAGAAYELQSRESEARKKVASQGGNGKPPPGKRWVEVEVPDGKEPKR